MPIPASPFRGNHSDLGDFAYDTGAAAGTTTVPDHSFVFNVACIAGVGGATVTIDGGGAIPVPAGVAFGVDLGGRKTKDTPILIVFGGAVTSRYVDWVQVP